MLLICRRFISFFIASERFPGLTVLGLLYLAPEKISDLSEHSSLKILKRKKSLTLRGMGELE